MLNQIFRYYHTLKYLKWIQIRYQLWYRLQGMVKYSKKLDKSWSQIQTKNLIFSGFISSPVAYFGENQFEFLNISHQFKSGIDWNYSPHGKLWTYNLNYFEFLAQPNISTQQGLNLMEDFIEKEKQIKDGMESFPISLRIIFWVKFLIENKVKNNKIDQSMYRQLQRLHAKPEYHLMGNHLLENGFGLLFGGIYFDDQKIIDQAEEIITIQLQEQILSDGAHFELSPMYHQIMLYRILDCINLLKSNPQNSTNNLLILLQKTASLMLGWMKNITFRNGAMPCLNDTTNGIAPTSKQLFEYAKNLNIELNQMALGESGYRKFSNKNIEAIVDVGKIGPDYIPGHAHSDTFNFILQYQDKPFIVDTGISTYEKNVRRNIERSTASHNTVMINGKEQSDVWGGFRIGKRAEITKLEETQNSILAIHDGYKNIGCEHQRKFSLQENQFQIEDLIIGKGEGIANLHFHPELKLELKNQSIIGTFGQIDFEGFDQVKLESYLFAQGFNQTQKAICAKITFKNKLKTSITFL